MPTTDPSSASKSVSRNGIVRISADELPTAFRMPISRVRSNTAVYIAMKTTMKPTTTATPITTPMKLFSIPTLLIESIEVNSSIV